MPFLTSGAHRRSILPPGYNGTRPFERPVSDTPLRVYMEEHGISDDHAAQDTGIVPGLIRHYKLNQVIPGLIHALRIQQKYKIPVESWLGTQLGQLMWEFRTLSAEDIRKVKQANNKKYADRRKIRILAEKEALAKASLAASKATT